MKNIVYDTLCFSKLNAIHLGFRSNVRLAALAYTALCSIC